MAETPEKKFITTFCEAWGEVAAPLLGGQTELGLLALREVQGDGVQAALAVAATWSLGFLTTCSGALPGILLGDDERELLTRTALEQNLAAMEGGVDLLLTFRVQLARRLRVSGVRLGGDGTCDRGRRTLGQFRQGIMADRVL